MALAAASSRLVRVVWRRRRNEDYDKTHERVFMHLCASHIDMSRLSHEHIYPKQARSLGVLKINISHADEMEVMRPRRCLHIYPYCLDDAQDRAGRGDRKRRRHGERCIHSGVHRVFVCLCVRTKRVQSHSGPDCRL